MDRNHFSLVCPAEAATVWCHRNALRFDGEVRLFVRGALLLRLGATWNFFRDGQLLFEVDCPGHQKGT